MDAKSRMEAALAAAKSIADAAEAASREFTGEEMGALKGHLDEAKAAKSELAAKSSRADLKSQLDALGADLGLEPTPSRDRDGQAEFRGLDGKSAGKAFVSGPEYKGFLAQFPGGRIGEKAQVQSAPMSVKSLVTGGSRTSGGALVVADRTDIFEPLARRPLTLRDIVTVRTTGSDTVEYVRQTAGPTAAAAIPEATSAAYIDGTTVTAKIGGLKPEGAMAFQVVRESVRTIAEWVPATKRALADSAQLQGLIDSELLADVAAKVEGLMLSGNGVDEDFTGLLNTSGVQAIAKGTDIFATARTARTKVRTVGHAIPTAYLLNPADWERFEMGRGSDGQFFGAAPFGAQAPTLFGLPIVESEFAPEGVGVVGDFSKAVLWDREQATISITDSHADFFIRNLVAVLAETRAAFGVTKPAAFATFPLV